MPVCGYSLWTEWQERTDRSGKLPSLQRFIRLLGGHAFLKRCSSKPVAHVISFRSAGADIETFIDILKKACPMVTITSPCGGTLVELARACREAAASEVLGLTVTKTAKYTRGMDTEKWPWG